MRLPLLVLLAFLTLAHAEINPSPSFILRFDATPSDPLASMGILKSPFFLVVKNGEAFLAASESPQNESDKRKGTVDLVFRNGIDPATKTFKDPIYQIVFHYDGPGWTTDRILTDIVVPMSPPKKGATPPLMVFAPTASMTSLWVTAKQDAVRVLADPMSIRMVQTLKCTTISSTLQPLRTE